MKKYIFNLIGFIIFVAICFTTQLIYAQNNNKGKWVLVKTNVFLPEPYTIRNWKTSVSGGSGSFTYKNEYTTCGYRVDATMTYSPPPAILTPGVKTDITASTVLSFVIPKECDNYYPNAGGGLFEYPLDKDSSKMFFTFSTKTIVWVSANKENTSASGKAVLIPPEAKGNNFYKICARFQGGAQADYIYEWKPNPKNDNENITNNENINENEEIPPNNNEIITSENQFIINLYNQSNSTIFTSPGEKNTCNLQADVDCSNSADEKGRTIKIEVLNGQNGSFNASTTSTDANGKAYFTYTAPDESALNGQKDIKVEIKATDVKSGEYSVIPITILNRNVKSGFSAQHNIMPQGKEFYNELTILINAPPKGDGYQATITTKDALGLITSSKTNPGGESPVSIKIKPGNEYKLYYHNTGSSTLSNPIEDEITLEIPDLNYKNTINISVGMNIVMTRVNRKYDGPIYPAMPEPLKVHIVDKFHKGADLASIFKDFDIKLRLNITSLSSSQVSVISKFEEDYLSRMLTMFEGYLLGPEISSPCGDFYAVPVKSDDGTYILVDQKAIGKTNREYYPTVTMFDRGEFSFRVNIAELNFTEDTDDNKVDVSLTVDQYRDECDEILKTALIPVAKSCLGLWGVKEKGYEGLKKIGDLLSIGDDISLAADFLKNGNIEDAFVNILGKFVGHIKDSDLIYNYITKNTEVITDYTKRLCNLYTFNINILEIIKLVVPEKEGEGGGNSTEIIDLQKKLKYPQLVVKGYKDNIAIIIDKRGIKNYNAALKNGAKLELMANKFADAKKIEQRIGDSKDFVIIPFRDNEEVNLGLDFSGSGGFLYRITKDKIDKIEYPKTSSGNIIVSVSNTLTFGKQEKEKTKEKEKKTNLFSGTWETADFGSVSFIISGNDVIATCTKNLAGMKGTLSSDGTKITGSWAKFPTYSSPNDAGKFEVTVSSDGKSFTGKWGNGTDSKAKLDKNLNGKKK